MSARAYMPVKVVRKSKSIQKPIERITPRCAVFSSFAAKARW